jgi:hypothetical protein
MLYALAVLPSWTKTPSPCFETLKRHTDVAAYCIDVPIRLIAFFPMLPLESMDPNQQVSLVPLEQSIQASGVYSLNHVMDSALPAFQVRFQLQDAPSTQYCNYASAMSWDHLFVDRFLNKSFGIKVRWFPITS